MEWMLLPLRRYFDFNGRSRRREYWMFALLNVIVLGVLMLLAVLAGVPVAALGDAAAVAGTIGMGLSAVIGLLVLAWVLAIIIPSIAVTIRRLHDRDLSGWWYLGAIVASMIPIIGLLASIALLVLLLLPGTPGPNRFGPDPKDPGQAAVFA